MEASCGLQKERVTLLAEELEEKVQKLEVEQGKHSVRLQAGEKEFGNQGEILKSIQGELKTMRDNFEKELKTMREDFGKRPTWSVLIVITMLSTLCGSMAIYIITNAGKGG